MYTIAYKWRLSTTRYAYITSTQYRVNGSDPDYTLAQIPATGKLDDATEQIIKDIVRNMPADEYRQCFENMLEKIANDKDGQYIKLKNWEYYYHFNTNENGDEKVFFVDATASATISNDGEVHAEVVNDRGTLKFTFQIPQGVNGKDGVDGKDGAPGVPVNDGKYVESIYKLTKTNNAPLIKLDDDWDIEGSEYQTNDYKPNGWTDRPSGITSVYKYEWVSTRKYDLVKKLWDEFSEPAIMSRWGEDGKDGDGIEYIYKRTTDEVNPGAPTVADWEDENSDYQTNDEYAKFLEYLGWTDEPVGTEKNGYKFEWVSVRKQKDGVWQQFSNPALWSSYGKDGDDVEYIYFLNNDNEVPSFDDYEIDSDDYQSENFLPKTNDVYWTDNYQSPTYEKRFSWISSRRKRDGKWLDFTGTTLFNVYKIGGKAYVDLYTRSNTRIDDHNLPSYDGNIYYSFNSDRFYSDASLINEITTVNGLNKTVWYTDIPVDNTAKMLFKTSALIEIKNDFGEIVAVPESSWYGPYLISSNGENATNQTPYINLNDNSLPLPVDEENKPHKEYLHSLVGKLLVDDDEAEITEAIITTSSGKNIKINSENINKDSNEFHLTFTINKDEKFTNIGIIYITLKGLYRDKEVIANTQYKIVPFYSDNAVAYKILLNQNSVFVPDNACEILPDGGIWNTKITAHVIDDKGDNVTVGDLLYEYEANKYASFKDNDNPEEITGTLKLIGCNNEEYLNNGYKLIQSLPNPLRLIYEINGKTLEIGYVDFNNMPKNGKDGISTRTIFAYCSTEENITPNAPTGGTVDFTTNEVTYPNGVDVNGDDVIWGSSIPLTGIVWLSTCEFSSDAFSGLWSTPIRLTGFKGAAGVSAYHLELTNDMDQVYTTDDNVVIKNQKVETIVSILKGNAPMYITADSITVTSINGFKVSKENVKSDSTNTEVKIIFELTGTTLTAKTINFNISVNGDEYGTTNFDFVKTFKIKKLNGTIDYDLEVFPTLIKKNKNNQYSESAITVNISERDIATDSKAVTTLTSFTEGLSITYFYNNDNDKQNSLTTLGDKIPVANVNGYNDEINKITVNLHKQGELIDQVLVECVSDGKDGESPYHIELSNDMDQVLTVDGIVKYEQEVNTILNLYYGSKKDETLTIDDVILPSNDNFTITGTTLNEQGDVRITIIPKTNKALEIGKNYEFPLGINTVKTKLNFNIEKIFKTVVLNTSIDYDLFVSNGIIKKAVNGYDTTKINIKVKKTDISRSDRSITYLTNLNNTNLYFVIYKDNINVPISNVTYNENGITLNIAELLPNTNILVQLYKKNDNGTNTLIDENVIEVVSDGKDGEPGVDGTNIEFIYKLFKDEADFNSDGNLFPNNSSITGTTKEEVLNQLNSKIVEGNIPKWSDSPCGITKDYKIEVSSQRIKEPGKTNWGSWSDVFIWSKWGEDGVDGDGVEYIFQITDRGVKLTNPGAEINEILTNPNYSGNTLRALTEIVNTFDFYPGEKWIEANAKLISRIAGNYDLNETYFNSIVGGLDLNWTDEPMDVGPYEPLEWVSIRRKKVNSDGTFEYTYSEPTIWAEWKRDTYDSLTEFMFTIYDSRVDLSQCTVTGCTWKDIKDGTVYTGVTTLSGDTVLNADGSDGIKWQDSVPNHNMFTQSVWMVKGFASGEIIYTGGTDTNGEQIPTGITYSNINWTSPTKLIDNQHMQVEYGFEVVDGMGQLVVPKPINLQNIVTGLGLNYDYTSLENAFREKDKESGYDFGWTDNPTGESPTWMITSTFYNGVWSDWVVSKIKGEKGETGETGQSIQIKGSFETLEDLQNAYKYFKNQINEKPSKYFNDNKLEIGDSYIVNESTVNNEKVFGYLYVFINNVENFDTAWETVGQIKGESSFIYIAYASSVTIDNNIKTYQLTEGGISENNVKYYGTTPGKYIGIHVATQQYEGHPYPPKLYSSPTIAEKDKIFLWNKWEGEDGFGQEQIFILSGKTAPNVPVYDSEIDVTKWNSNDFVPEGWSDVPLTTSDSDNERCCWMATRRFPAKNAAKPNEFIGVSGQTGGTAILFSYYAIDGENGIDGKSPFHIELSNEFDLISVVNGCVNGEQTYTTSFELWEGDIDRTSSITSITIYNIDNIGEKLTVETGSTAFTLTFKDGYELNETIYGILKINTKNNKSYHRTFTIKPINDSVIHQLQVDKGYVVIGEQFDIIISAVTKTSSGIVLMTDNINKKINIKESDTTTSTTANTFTYTYSGGNNDIKVELYINDELYDYILVEAKNDIKPIGTLNINPINQVVYVEKIENEEDVKYKPLVSSVTFDASFVYEGSEKPLTGVSISVTGSSNDFSPTPVISDYGIEVKYLDYLNLTTDNLTKERYIFETNYNGDKYYNNFFITYVEPKLDVWIDGDCIYIPDVDKGGLSKEFIFEAKFENSNVTHDCEIEVEGYTGITFNLRNNCWYINIPSEVTSDNDLTGFTINFIYNGISTSKEVAIIRRGKNSENWYINVFPKYLSIVNEPINLYITKNNYNGEYISLENALTQNMKLYYIIDGECVNVDENGNEITTSEICYSDNLEYAPKEHGNNAFYPNGILKTTTTDNKNELGEVVETIYTQEPIYSSIEFKLYYEPDGNHKELVASEIVERYDVIRDSKMATIHPNGLEIDVRDLFEDYDSEKYDIVIKEIKK